MLWRALGWVASVIAALVVIVLVFWLIGSLGKAGYGVWASPWSTTPVCVEGDIKACTDHDKLLVLQTEVKSGEKIGITKLMDEAKSAASVQIAMEKARLAEDNFNRRARELEARAAQLAAQQAVRTSSPTPSNDPCSSLRGRVKDICLGL